jgi:hypothetical protein
MEKLWKSEYDLSEFTNPKQFKPYSEIKKKFLLAINAPTVSVSSEENDNEEPEVSEPAPQRVQRESRAETARTAVDDDDDFKLFSSLIDE